MSRSALGTIDPATTSGTTLAAILSSRDAAENSGHLGSGRPTYATEGMVWSEDSFDPAHLWLGGAAGDGSEDVDLTLLFAPRPGTMRTTAEVRLPSGWLWADGTAVLRADYPDLLDAIAPAFTGTVTSGSPTITSVSEDLRQLGLVGGKLEGAGITAGTTITAISASTITMSANATASNTATAIRAFVWGTGNGSTTFNTPNVKGRSMVPRGDMGGTDVALITVLGSGFDGTKLAAAGGSQAVQLLVANLPIHSHSASSSGTTDTHAGHTHGPGTYGTDASGTHTHNYTRTNIAVELTSDSFNRINVDHLTPQTTTATSAGGNHSHSVTTGASASGGSHSHVLTLSTTVGNTGSDAAHLNVQPSVIVNVLVKT